MSKTKKLTRARRAQESKDNTITVLKFQLALLQSRTHTAEEECRLSRAAVDRCDRSMALLAHYLLKAMDHGSKASVIHTLMRMASPAGVERIFEKFSNEDIDMDRDYRVAARNEPLVSPMSLDDYLCGFSRLQPIEIKALAVELQKDWPLFSGQKGMVMKATVGGFRGRHQCFAVSEEALRYMPIDVVLTDAVAQMLEEIRK